MYKVNLALERGTDSHLARMIEPLASYICATDQPRAALRSALTALFSEVEQTHRAATAHVATFSEDR